jgi:hypothetical protein
MHPSELLVRCFPGKDNQTTNHGVQSPFLLVKRTERRQNEHETHYAGLLAIVAAFKPFIQGYHENSYHYLCQPALHEF